MKMNEWKQMLKLEKKSEEKKSDLNEDILTDMRKALTTSFEKITPSAVVGGFVLALQNAYDDGKVTKSYINKTIAAMQSAQKRLGKL